MGKPTNEDNPITSTPKELYRDELEKGSNRIGSTIDDMGRWFARFAQTDLQSLSTGAWSDLLYEVACLSEFQYQLASERALWSLAITVEDWQGKDRTKNGAALSEFLSQFLPSNRDACAFPIPLPPYTVPPREAVGDLQRATIEALTRLAEKGEYDEDLPAVRLMCIAQESTDEIVRIGILKAPRDLFKYNRAWTIGMAAVRIRRCEGCAKWFFADRKNKTYCSLSCQTCAGTRRWRIKLKAEGQKQKRVTAKHPPRLHSAKKGARR